MLPTSQKAPSSRIGIHVPRPLVRSPGLCLVPPSLANWAVHTVRVLVHSGQLQSHEDLLDHYEVSLSWYTQDERGRFDHGATTGLKEPK